MEKYYNEFVTKLYDFILDLNRYYPNKGSKDFLKVFNKLDIGKVIMRFFNKMNKFEKQLENKDESIFLEQIIILPNINLSEIWTKLSQGQKNKIWTYLQILYIQAELILKYKKNSNNDEIDEKTGEDREDNKIKFNPYVGVGNANENYTINEMFSGNQNIPDDTPQPGLDSFVNMIGIDKKLDQILEQFKNMSNEEIDEATKDIKNLIVDNTDEQYSNIINDMLRNITTELKKEDSRSGNPLDNIMNIAKTVATSLQPKIQSENVDMSSLINSMQNMGNQYKDGNGNGINPFDFFSKINNINNINDANENVNEEVAFGEGEFTEKQYMEYCNNILKNMKK